MHLIKTNIHYRPFTLKPAQVVLIPKCSAIAVIYPTRIVLSDQNHHANLELSLTDVESFQVTSDLEKGVVIIRLMTKPRNLVQYTLSAYQKGIHLTLNRSNIADLSCQLALSSQEGVKTFSMKAKKSFVIMPTESSDDLKADYKLYLGCDKKQCIDSVLQRGSLNELLQLIIRTSQWLPFSKPVDDKGLIQPLKEAFSQPVIQGEKTLQHILRASLDGLLYTHASDIHHWGLASDPSSNTPWAFMHQITRCVISNFIEVNGDTITFLKSLFPSLHTGKITNFPIDDGILSLEWSKKAIKRVEIKVQKQKTLQLFFKHKKSVRVGGIKRMGCRPLELTIAPCSTIVLDQFQQ